MFELFQRYSIFCSSCINGISINVVSLSVTVSIFVNYYFINDRIISLFLKGRFGTIKLVYPATFYRSACTKPVHWSGRYLCLGMLSLLLWCAFRLFVFHFIPLSWGVDKYMSVLWPHRRHNIRTTWSNQYWGMIVLLTDISKFLKSTWNTLTKIYFAYITG